MVSVLNQLTLHHPNDSALEFVIKGFATKLKDALTGVWDPEITFNLGDRVVRFKLSHRFPNYFTRWPNYDRVLPRLCQKVKDVLGTLTVIDVGANVGETVNLIDARVQGKYLCIEPSKNFFTLLQENTKSIKEVVLENIAVAEKVVRDGSRMLEGRGTAHFVSDGGVSSETTEILTLDSLLQERHPEFLDANVLKTDTDGYDFKVIQGSERLLARSKPSLFFEFAPGFLEGVGHDDPFNVFPYVIQHGYDQFLFYDNCGYMMTPVSAAQMDIIRGLIEYARRRPFIWLDVAAFHSERRTLFSEFLSSEIALKPVPARGYEHRYETRHFQ